MKTFEVSGYCDDIPKVSFVASKVSVISVHHECQDKTNIWVDGISEPFMSSDNYEDVIKKRFNALK